MYINSEQKNVRHLRCFGLIRKKKCVIFVVEHKYDSNKNKQFFVIHCHSLPLTKLHSVAHGDSISLPTGEIDGRTEGQPGADEGWWGGWVLFVVMLR